MEKQELCRLALEARKQAYAPYSRFQVGAALLCRDGSVYTGGNIENAAYSVTNCAERTALFKAVSEGKREFSALAVAGGPEGVEPEEICAPCGVCRQALREFCGSDFPVLLVRSSEEYEEMTLAELLPCSFGPGNLSK